MNFYNKLEQKFGKYAIPNLMNYLVILYAAGAVIQMVNSAFYYNYMSLNAAAIFRGEIWRLITFLICPPVTGNFNLITIFFNILMIYLYYNIGTTLERVWGAFRFNTYMFVGIIGHILAALIIYMVSKISLILEPSSLNMSLFLAFALTFPDMQFMLYFVIPIKAKWLAAFYIVIELFSFISGNLVSRVSIALSFLNFIIFFILTRNYRKINPKEIKRKNDFKRNTKIMARGTSNHKCAVCGRTEADVPDMEFRYCSKCDGDYEYCMDHLYTHKHVVKDDKIINMGEKER